MQSLTDKLWKRTCPWEALLKRVLSLRICGEGGAIAKNDNAHYAPMVNIHTYQE